MVNLDLPLLRETLDKATVVKRNGYVYFIHPLTDTIPPIKPELLGEICDAIIRIADVDVDVIVTMEAMGIHIASVLSQKTGLPFNVVRKRQYWLPGEVVLDQETGYSRGTMFINGIKPGDRVLVVDAVISTGGTLTAVLNGLKRTGVSIRDVVCVIERGDGAKAVREKTGFKVKTLVKIEVDERVRVVDRK